MPLTLKLSFEPSRMPMGWVEAPYRPTHTMTSYEAFVVMALFCLSAARNISTQTFAFIPEVSNDDVSVELKAELPAL